MRLLVLGILSCAFMSAAHAESEKYGATVRAPERQAAVLRQAIKLQREFRPIWPNLGTKRGADSVYHSRYSGRASFYF
jgi:hypothetical protein